MMFSETTEIAFFLPTNSSILFQMQTVNRNLDFSMREITCTTRAMTIEPLKLIIDLRYDVGCAKIKVSHISFEFPILRVFSEIK